MLCNSFIGSKPVFGSDDINQSESHQPPAALYHGQLQGSVKTSQGHVIGFSPWFHACTSYSKHTIDRNCPIKLVQTKTQQQLESAKQSKRRKKGAGFKKPLCP